MNKLVIELRKKDNILDTMNIQITKKATWIAPFKEFRNKIRTVFAIHNKIR